MKDTVVIGGGPTGCEISLHLAENGSRVTIVEMLPYIGGNLESITKKMVLKNLEANHVQMITGFKLSRIENNGVVLSGETGQTLFVKAERVVIAVGSRPNNSLYDTIGALGYEVHKIGDCREPRSAKAAIVWVSTSKPNEQRLFSHGKVVRVFIGILEDYI